MWFIFFYFWCIKSSSQTQFFLSSLQNHIPTKKRSTPTPNSLIPAKKQITSSKQVQKPSNQSLSSELPLSNLRIKNSNSESSQHSTSCSNNNSSSNKNQISSTEKDQLLSIFKDIKHKQTKITNKETAKNSEKYTLEGFKQNREDYFAAFKNIYNEYEELIGFFDMVKSKCEASQIHGNDDGEVLTIFRRFLSGEDPDEFAKKHARCSLLEARLMVLRDIFERAC